MLSEVECMVHSSGIDQRRELYPLSFMFPTADPLVPYIPNYYRIAALSVKCFLSLLVIIMSATIRRDFLKYFTLFLMIPIVLDCGFDIYTEVETSITSYGSRTFQWKLFNGTRFDVPTIYLQHESLGIYQEALAHYTTYNIYSATKPFALVCYILSDILFWSTLFTSVAAFYYAHTAIIRSEEISYIPYIWSFLKVQVFPILFTVIDTLITVFQIPFYVELGAITIVRLTACLAIVTILTQISAVYASLSGFFSLLSTQFYVLKVRDGKWRLFSFILFQIVVHILTIPYLFWSAISLAQDFLVVLDFPSQYVQALPLHQAADMFVVHITTFVVRPFLILITILSLIAPYRKTFLLLFCPCCPHNS
ncbi:hypothetical protein Angca_000241 [Angiostrongylus cantonensis]|nr:hypothetical protein Angca_000241 [Angiostrongylus cantonensis]